MKIGRKLTGRLYRYARLTNDVTTLLSFDAGKIIKRLLNKWIGRKIIKRGWFR